MFKHDQCAAWEEEVNRLRKRIAILEEKLSKAIGVIGTESQLSSSDKTRIRCDYAVRELKDEDL